MLQTATRDGQGGVGTGKAFRGCRHDVAQARVSQQRFQISHKILRIERGICQHARCPMFGEMPGVSFGFNPDDADAHAAAGRVT